MNCSDRARVNEVNEVDEDPQNLKFKVTGPDHNNVFDLHIDHPVIKGYSSFNADTCRIIDIYVMQQRQGYGRLLLTKTENELKAHNCKEIYLRSVPKAQAFYRHCGYELDPNLSSSVLFTNYKKQLPD